MNRAPTITKPIFDSGFVLNLKRRVDRWGYVQKQILKSGIAKFVATGTIERVEGIDGEDATQVDVKGLWQQRFITELGYRRFQLPQEMKLFGMDLTKGAIGCALTHRQVWKRICDSQCQAALVLEDDVEFSPKLAKSLPILWERVPPDWGIVYLGGLDLLSTGKPPRPFVAEGVRRAYQGHRELTAYVINAQSAKRCLQLSEAMTWQIDTHICSLLADDPVAQDQFIADPVSYVFQPSLAIQITSHGTDVQVLPAENHT